MRLFFIMEICSHMIDKNQIIGIGPLMNKHFTNGIDSFYKRLQLSFIVHCRQQSILIESDIVEREGVEDLYKVKNQNYLDSFTQNYEQVKKEISSLIN